MVAQPDRRRERAATLRSARLVIDQHRLGARVLAIVRQREQHSPPPTRLADRARPAGEHEDRRLAPLPPHFELAPADAEAEPGAERLEARLLRREPGGQVRDGVPARATVGELLLGEDALEEAVLPPPRGPASARDLHQSDPDAAHPPPPPAAGPPSITRSIGA